MKLTTHPFKSDLLTITADELNRIANGEELKVSALVVKLEKPDSIVYPSVAISHDGNERLNWFVEGKLKLRFDGNSGELKSAEVVA